jgi:hypothetical protein
LEGLLESSWLHFVPQEQRYYEVVDISSGRLLGSAFFHRDKTRPRPLRDSYEFRDLNDDVVLAVQTIRRGLGHQVTLLKPDGSQIASARSHDLRPRVTIQAGEQQLRISSWKARPRLLDAAGNEIASLKKLAVPHAWAYGYVVKAEPDLAARLRLVVLALPAVLNFTGGESQGGGG